MFLFSLKLSNFLNSLPTILPLWSLYKSVSDGFVCSPHFFSSSKEGKEVVCGREESIQGGQIIQAVDSDESTHKYLLV